MLDGTVPARALLAFGRDRIDVRGIERERRAYAGVLRLIGELFEQKCRPLGTLIMQDGAQRIDPFARFHRIGIGSRQHLLLPLSDPLKFLDIA
jgi:hypothetical protein